MNKDTTMTVLVVEPGEAPYSKQMEHDLESLQKAVGGHIQCVYPFEDPIGIICDEEGKYKGYPLNRALRNEESEIYDVIAGTFLVVGLSSDNFASLSSELMEKYKAFSKLFTRKDLNLRNEALKAADKCTSVLKQSISELSLILK